MEKEQEYTTIRISVKLWKKLNELKRNPSQTPEDIVWGIMENKKDVVEGSEPSSSHIQNN